MTLLRRLGFNLWYLSRPPWDSGVSPPELLEYIRDHPPGRAIDIGCGTGTNVIALAKAGWRVCGVDFAGRAIRIARRKAARSGVNAELLADDAARLTQVGGPFDLALDIGCFHSVKDRPGYLAALRRILAPGGTWLLYAFVHTQAGQGEPGLGPGDLDQIASSGFLLKKRTDGFERGRLPSAWFEFRYE